MIQLIIEQTVFTEVVRPVRLTVSIVSDTRVDRFRKGREIHGSGKVWEVGRE
jgi:hypothetical protein